MPRKKKPAEEEIWKDIPGMPGYQASSKGNIRRTERVSTVIEEKRKYTRTLAPKPLRQQNQRGYRFVSIMDHNYSVHRLVAKAFIPNPENKETINHIDGVKNNNNISNLEWATRSENEQHSYRVLGKTVWNKGVHYDTTNAVKVRTANYHKTCLATLEAIEKNHTTISGYARSIGMSSRQIIERVKLARALRKEGSHE